MALSIEKVPKRTNASTIYKYNKSKRLRGKLNTFFHPACNISILCLNSAVQVKKL